MNNADKNIWYALATLHGADETEHHKQNRVLWNRWMSTRFDEATKRAILSGQVRGHDIVANEFDPLSDTEVSDVLQRLSKRGFSAQELRELDAFRGSASDRIDFDGCGFARSVDFSNFCFPLRASFDGASFLGDLNAYGAYFHSYGSFKGTAFHGSVHFGWTTFVEYAPFHSSNFLRYAVFSGAKFLQGVDFNGATVSGHIDFDHVEFDDMARFENVSFSDRANFYKARFRQAAFRNARFADSADFDCSVFSGEADFFGSSFACRGTGPMNLHYRMEGRSERHDQPALAASFRQSRFNQVARFENTSFMASSSFDRAAFELEPPRFFGATLHQQMEWRNVCWPTARSKDNAAVFVDAYSCLKLEMDRLKKHEDELDFFAHELQAKRVMSGWLKGAPITIFSLLADCGRSYIRPVVALCISWAVFVPVYLTTPGWAQLKDAMGLSLASTFGVFGFRKEFVQAAILDQMTGLTKLVSGTQTLLGAILLFLVGLALRNKLRMK
jgi:uncharacterized protein YjbI with pentapeptide repeats